MRGINHNTMYISHATQSALSHVFAKLDRYTVQAIKHPQARLKSTPDGTYGVVAPTTDPDCITGLDYFHQIPLALYKRLELHETNK